LSKPKIVSQHIDVTTVISRQVAAELLGLDPSRISQLMTSGHIVRVDRGKTTLAHAAQGYAAYWHAIASDQTKTSADNRMRDARAKEIEMRIAEKERTLIPLEDADYVMTITASKFRDLMMSLPDRYTRDLAERRKLEDLIHADLNALADAFAEAGRELRDGDAEFLGEEGNDRS
jgi:phage terminase Nu1 subunit (DNA packaging protein)